MSQVPSGDKLWAPHTLCFLTRHLNRLIEHRSIQAHPFQGTLRPACLWISPPALFGLFLSPSQFHKPVHRTRSNYTPGYFVDEMQICEQPSNAYMRINPAQSTSLSIHFTSPLDPFVLAFRDIRPTLLIIVLTCPISGSKDSQTGVW